MRSLARRLFLVAPRAAEGRIEAVLVQRLLQRLGLHHVGVQRASRGSNGLMPSLHALLVDVDDQVEAELAAPSRSRNAIISRNFQVVSTCSSGNGGLAG